MVLQLYCILLQCKKCESKDHNIKPRSPRIKHGSDGTKDGTSIDNLMDGFLGLRIKIFLSFDKMAFLRGVLIVLSILCLKTTSKPVVNGSLKIKNKDLLPKDHIPAVKLERDGHINPEFHHEAFLGRLVEEGKLNPKDVDGSKHLIEIFHKVDLNKNHKVDRQELTEWIHKRIQEHYDYALKVNNDNFKKADQNNDGILDLREYLQGLTKDNENDALKLGEQSGLLHQAFSFWGRALDCTKWAGFVLFVQLFCHIATCSDTRPLLSY